MSSRPIPPVAVTPGVTPGSWRGHFSIVVRVSRRAPPFSQPIRPGCGPDPKPTDPDTQNLPTGLARTLHRGLLVIVGAEAKSTTKITGFRYAWSAIGRLSVDVDVDPTVDQLGIPSQQGHRIQASMVIIPPGTFVQASSPDYCGESGAHLTGLR